MYSWQAFCVHDMQSVVHMLTKFFDRRICLRKVHEQAEIAADAYQDLAMLLILATLLRILAKCVPCILMYTAPYETALSLCIVQMLVGINNIYHPSN